MRLSTKIISLAVVLMALGLTGSRSRALGEQVIYVDAGASGAADGTGWIDAYTDLQDALAEAAGPERCTPECPCEIWVTGGVYKPDRGTGDREASFELRSNVALYGGFAGGETLLRQRDWLANETILTGDLLDDDDPTFIPESDCCFAREGTGCSDPVCEAAVCDDVLPQCCSRLWDVFCAETVARWFCCDLCRRTHCENSYHVVVATETDASGVLDGFTITAGEANSSERGDWNGGGLYVYLGNPTIRNCVFVKNAAREGGGVYNESGDPSLTNCTFTDNLTYTVWGVGMRSFLGHPSLTDCSFIANQGGYALRADRDVLLVNCRFVGNVGEGGLRSTVLLTGGFPVLIDCTFRGNDGMGLELSAPSLLIGCSFIGNSRGGMTLGSVGKLLHAINRRW